MKYNEERSSCNSPHYSFWMVSQCMQAVVYLVCLAVLLLKHPSEILLKIKLILILFGIILAIRPVNFIIGANKHDINLVDTVITTLLHCLFLYVIYLAKYLSI